jgi:hypothetical protein
MVMSLRTVRAVFGTALTKVPAVQSRAQAMHDGFAADPVTYANPPIPLPDFLGLIQKLALSQQAVKTRVIGARQTRDADLGALVTGMHVQRAFLQSIADKNQARAAAIITNGGLVVALVPVHTKALLTLRNTKQSGSISCDACVKLLVGAGTTHPAQARFFGWQLTIDGGKTFTTLPSTSRHKTLVPGLTPLTTVGIRVNLTNSEGAGPWSDVVTIVVR